jgi:hypothetical protein
LTDKDCDDLGHHSNKCCDDRQEHNLAESLEERFPLLCKGKFSMNEEKFFDMLLNNIPEEYKQTYFFDVYSDEIHEQQQEAIANECEARMDRD